MTDKLKQVLARTEANLTNHLERLNDSIDQNDGVIDSPQTLDDIGDCVKDIKNIHKITGGNGESAAAKAAPAKAVPPMI